MLIFFNIYNTSSKPSTFLHRTLLAEDLAVCETILMAAFIDKSNVFSGFVQDFTTVLNAKCAFTKSVFKNC